MGGTDGPKRSSFWHHPVVPESAIPPPAGTPEPVGHIAWLDLTVTDASTTRTFYEQVVGWAVQEVGMKDTDEDYADFNMLGANGKPVAGICHARGVNQGLPPVWMMYLPVGDLAESLRRVEEGGGKTIYTTQGSDGKHKYAVIQDPIGVCVALAAG